jgi:hypothetical protein
MKTESEKTIQERYKEIPQSERAKMMFQIKKREKEQNQSPQPKKELPKE